ncbi:SPOR domain-containing protein [Mangrovicella endophytica]|uniref:SPOR domain-containing protein n=1 Tax=Mangrovicella endophytica TaxID=2066697 RepID=UPI000C9E1BC5|nr:SPOR domain-containing protein [Mangrovicella endophytica]
MRRIDRRSMVRLLTVAASLAAAPTAPALAAQTLAGEWWVVLGTSPAPDATGMEFPDALRASEAAERCGLSTMGDFTAKFEGFAPDLYVSVAGGWDSRAEALEALARVQPCVPRAYVKRGLYIGGD